VPESGAGFGTYGSTSTVTLPATGKVFVTLTGTWQVQCSAAGPCDSQLAAFVDGTEVTGAHIVVNSPANSGKLEDLAVSGILTNVAAGQHTVALKYLNSADVSSINPYNIHVDAVALGNG
jgi:hypothetical protein